jgi:hypothetical protein
MLLQGATIHVASGAPVRVRCFCFSKYSPSKYIYIAQSGQPATIALRLDGLKDASKK